MLCGPDRMCQTTVFHLCFRVRLLKFYVLCLKSLTWQYLTLVNTQLVLNTWALRNARPSSRAGLPQGEENKRTEQKSQICLGLAVMGQIGDICGRNSFFIVL